MKIIAFDRSITDKRGFITPPAPDVDFIRLLHVRGDSFVSFARIDAGKFVDIGSVRVNRLETMFPEFVAELTVDSYFSINGFFRAGSGPGAVPNLRRSYRRQDGIRYLNAVWADLDVYNVEGLTHGTVLGRIYDAMEAGTIPPVSLITDSGRGFWVFWLLSPEKGFAEKVELQQRVQQALHDQLKHLGADPGAKDISRLTRIPGSVNTKANRCVSFIAFYDEQGRNPRYRLADLRDFFGIETRPVRRFRATKKVPRRVNGYRARYEKALRDFQVLRAHRGGFPEGMRHHACFYYAGLLERNGYPKKEIRQEVDRLARECRPPCPEAATAAMTSKPDWPISYQWVAECLKITAAENDLLAGDYLGAETARPRIEKQHQRRAEIAAIIRAFRGLEFPSLRRIKKVLDNRGISASLDTIARDLRALGLHKRGKAVNDSKDLFYAA